MNRQEFGQLVAALRKEVFLESGDRYTQGMLGEDTGIGVNVIGSIERGGKAKFEDDILVKLADALKLTSWERQEFYLAGAGVETRFIENQGDEQLTTRKGLVKMLEGIQVPAFVKDAYGDVVAANELVIRFFGISENVVVQGRDYLGSYHMINLLFHSEGFARKIYGDVTWERIVIQNINDIRRTSLRYRHTPYWQALFTFLKKRPKFKSYWDITRAEKFGNGIDPIIQSGTSAFGRVNYISIASPSITPFGEVYLVVYIPKDLETMSLFMKIAKTGTQIHKLADWPNKQRLLDIWKQSPKNGKLKQE